uniref:F-box protein n=1 Tax=Panagrolaimus superbus TaxID=310955 RepID=A0A914Y1C3_9BILA
MSQFGSFWSKCSASGCDFRAGSSRGGNGGFGRHGFNQSVHRNMNPKKLRCWNCKLKHALTAKSCLIANLKEITERFFMTESADSDKFPVIIRIVHKPANTHVVVEEDNVVAQSSSIQQDPVPLSGVKRKTRRNYDSPKRTRFIDRPMACVEWNLPLVPVQHILSNLDIIDIASLYYVSCERLKCSIHQLYKDVKV